MDNKRIIEMVCSANHGRSPVAELVARNRLEDLGVSDFYDVASSGIRVNEMIAVKARRENMSIKDAKWCIQKALGRNDIFLGSVRKDAEKLFSLNSYDSNQERTLHNYAHQALMCFETEEAKYRQEAVRELGLRGELKKTQDHLQVLPGRVLILGMEPRHVESIAGCYVGSGLTPILDTLKGYAFETPGAQFPSAYGGSFEEYLEMASEIKGLTQRAMDRLVIK